MSCKPPKQSCGLPGLGGLGREVMATRGSNVDFISRWRVRESYQSPRRASLLGGQLARRGAVWMWGGPQRLMLMQEYSRDEMFELWKL